MSGKGKASASAAPASKAAAAAPEPMRGPRACYNCGETDGHSLDNCPMRLDRERVRRNKEAAAKAREEAAAKAATVAASGPAVKDPKRKAQRGGVVATEKPAVEIGSAVVAQWQRTPLQLVSEYCQREKRPKPQLRLVFFALSLHTNLMRIVCFLCAFVPACRTSNKQLAFSFSRRLKTDLTMPRAKRLARRASQWSCPMPRTRPRTCFS
jgi:hypothetical protein